MRSGPGKLAALVGGAAALAGGMALVNRALLLDDLPPTLPGAMHDWTWRGWRVRYTRLGQGSPVVLVHGIHAAASSCEMRNLFEPLSQGHTVYAIDLLGFGKSERPRTRYSGALYADLLADFVTDVVAGPVVLVGSSSSAAYAVAAGRARPDLVDHLVLISPADATRRGASGRAFGRLLALPLVGSAAFNVLVSRASLRSFLRRLYADPALVDDPLVDQHWATAHQPNARLAPAAFLAGQLDLTIGTPGAAVVAPILVVRGSTPGIGVEIPDDQLRALGPNVSFATIEGAGQLPHDEAADRVLAAVESWLDGRAGRAGEQR
jgi:pimeloyl-ACP methyl ester carboxylesterase